MVRYVYLDFLFKSKIKGYEEGHGKRDTLSGFE